LWACRTLMTALPDMPETDNAESGAGAINPLAIAVFVVALVIGGLLIWLSFAGGDARPSETVVALPAAGDNGPETLLSGSTATVPPEPQVLDGTGTVPVSDGTSSDGDATAADGSRLQAIGSLPLVAPGAPLTEAPITGLYEETSGGLLPVTAADGRRSVASYGRPFEAPAADDTRPRIALMITGLGLNRTFAERALEQLPADVSLAYMPYSSDLQEQVNKARDDGHEVALQLPMEPFDYPDNDPGPYTLLTSLPEEANRKRLEWLLARTSGYFATINHQGGRFLSEAESLSPILTALRDRGVGFIDTGDGARNATEDAVPETGLAWGVADQVVDVTKSQRQIDKALSDLEDTARQSGLAMGIGTALPVTVERVAEWAAGLEEKGISLVPVSAVLAANSAPPGADQTETSSIEPAE